MGATHTKPTRWGVLAEFSSAQQIYHACEQVRDAGFKKWDAYTPFPVHGLDKAQGLPASFLPWIVLVVGLTGTATAIGLQYWVHAIAYPLVISGKPFAAWPAYVPIIFELSVLFSAFAAVFGMLAINRLPMLNHPLFTSERFGRASDDRFFIAIEATDPKFDADRTTAFLQGLGADHVEFVE
ncbi:MAG: DUF3341 domain-containing protein [Myxococcales bacterium]|nr:DUF3341 domain-containing protein [Myxococcales bacterium]MCB9519335.1 DUF3341 domain-containing protein [Myxococcales bacterium]MCB9530779.1 DUF3341 domain-containing protein [Myxococcales bacterium]